MKHDRMVKEALSDSMFGTNYQDLSWEQRRLLSRTEASLEHHALHELANRYKTQQRLEEEEMTRPSHPDRFAEQSSPSRSGRSSGGSESEYPETRESAVASDQPATVEEVETLREILENAAVTERDPKAAAAVAHGADEALMDDNRLTMVNVARGCGGHAEVGNKLKGSRDVKDHSVSRRGGGGGGGAHQEFFNKLMSRPEENEGFVGEGEREEDVRRTEKMHQKKRQTKGHPKPDTRSTAAAARAHNEGVRSGHVVLHPA